MENNNSNLMRMHFLENSLKTNQLIVHRRWIFWWSFRFIIIINISWDNKHGTQKVLIWDTSSTKKNVFTMKFTFYISIRRPPAIRILFVIRKFRYNNNNKNDTKSRLKFLAYLLDEFHFIIDSKIIYAFI